MFDIRIGVDFHVFDGKFQGSRSYLIGLYKSAIRISSKTKFIFFVNNVESLINEGDEFRSSNVEIVRIPRCGSILRLTIIFPYLCQKHNINILHTQYIIPPILPCKSIVTVHDILFESNPEFFQRKFVIRSKILVRFSSVFSNGILTVSEFSKNDIIKRYNIKREKISITKNSFEYNKFNIDRNHYESVLNIYGLKEHEFILTVGRLEPRKNHINLIKAYINSSITVPLVIVGQPDFNNKDIFREIDIAKSKKKLIVLSDIDDSSLPSIYRGCSLFVYPSFAEGFGMPPLEAMAAGAPVVCSKTTAIPEVVDDAAILIDPKSIDDIKNGMELVFYNKDLREKLIKSGLLLAKKSSWDDSAKNLIDKIYSI